MTRLRELIEKAATTPLTEDERQELQRHFVGLAQREAHIVQIIRAEEAEEIADDNRFLRLRCASARHAGWPFRPRR
jgi:hypothetical protein